MRKNRFQRALRWTFVCVAVCSIVETASAGSFTRSCAARDLQILMLIEERESTRSVPADRLDDAMLTMMHARIVCHEGHVMDAMKIYNSIAESIAPEPVLAARHDDSVENPSP